ncbi:alpha-1,3-arabinosyltransferase XAT3-like [Zingiber officinale]|uniref:Glycosyltransferase 61 catalytic domain-containing protein n=1 Tax=Zingiber officinale TaxID=94328 RepID=A0A8J5L4C4_ZINOF|nr:alpha-1,3-arabinosyltransferase XAT3-like [Zingiber officinale]KAG6505377.1 hypothetical protein ZIOFF_037733 [Zingiber officinale]
MKLAKKLRPPVEPRSFGTGLIVGCFLVSMTYFMLSRKQIVSCLPSLLTDADPTSSAVQSSEEFHFSDGEEVIEAGKPMCDRSSFRVDICDMEGDVRIVGSNLSSVTLIAPPAPASGGDGGDSSWQMKPYPRKYDFSAMAKVRPLNFSWRREEEAALRCAVNHSVVGVLFSTGGHCGNCFHDYADVLIPLFQTVSPLKRRVQFIISDYQGWWMHKYRPYLTNLSDYDVIDFNSDDRVHCFRRLIVGLRAERDLIIDPSPPSHCCSISHFVELTRTVYSLGRDRAWRREASAAAASATRPRLVFIARGGTRRFVNMEELMAAAEDVGFEAVASEPDFYDVAQFGRVVNSADVMVGVHGAGLTNFLFLPAGAVLIQVVPLGNLEWISQHFYAEPAMARNLWYLQYNITQEESTLMDLYPRDHEVFKDPDAIHKQGWFKLGDIYLKQQNVRLDVQRFRPTLEKAMDLLYQRNLH